MQQYHEYETEQDVPPLDSLTTPETLELPELTEQEAELDYNYLQELEQQGMLQDQTQIDMDEKLIEETHDPFKDHHQDFGR